jgi:hypothetical protein
VVLLYDTCESGSLTGPNIRSSDIDERLDALNRLTRATGRTFLTATTDDARHRRAISKALTAPNRLEPAPSAFAIASADNMPDCERRAAEPRALVWLKVSDGRKNLLIASSIPSMNASEQKPSGFRLATCCGTLHDDRSPDMLRHVNYGLSSRVRLWDAASGRELREFTGHTKNLYAVAFSPDDRREM